MPARLCSNGPTFLTIAETIGANPHEDVALWYPLQGRADHVPDYDLREYRNMRWFRFDDAPFDESDPNLERFVQKFLELGIAA